MTELGHGAEEPSVLMWPTRSSFSDVSNWRGNSPSAQITVLVQISQHRGTEWSWCSKLHSVRPRASPHCVRRVRTERDTVQPGTLRIQAPGCCSCWPTAHFLPLASRHWCSELMLVHFQPSIALILSVQQGDRRAL